MSRIKFLMIAVAGTVATAPAGAAAFEVFGKKILGCTDCVEVVIEKKGDLVYDPIFGNIVSERAPLPISKDACIERDYFDRCLRNGHQLRPDDVFVRAEDGSITRTRAVGARVVPGGETELARSPGK